MADLYTAPLRLRASKLAEEFTDREQSRETPRRRVFAEDLAEIVLMGRPIEPLVLHFFRDNPNASSLRQHAAFYAQVARSAVTALGQPWAPGVRRRAAVQARALLMAARRCEVACARRLP